MLLYDSIFTGTKTVGDMIMDKKEILEKNRQQNHNNLDEREKKIYNFSFGLGAVVVGILCLVFSVYKALHHEPFYEYVRLITAYLCTTFIYQFTNLRKVMYLVAGIVTGLEAVWCIMVFFGVIT